MKAVKLFVCLIVLSLSATAQNNNYPTTGNPTIYDYSPTIYLQRNTSEGGYTQGIQTRLSNGANNWFFGNLYDERWMVAKGDYMNPKLTVFANGNIGVGTSNPLQKFVVSNQDQDGLEVYLQQPTGIVGLQAYNRTSSSYVGMQFDASSFAFTGGNLGIGMSSPNHRLTVNGNVKLADRGMGYLINYASLSETNGGSATILGNNVVAGVANNTIRTLTNPYDPGSFISQEYIKGITFHTGILGSLGTDVAANVNERMRITQDGNVGIGTSSPQAKLDVNGSAIINGPGATLTLRKYTNNIPAIAFQGLAPVATTTIEANDDFLTTYLAGARRFTVLANGNVGIGADGPTEKLSIFGVTNAYPGVISLESSRNDAAYVEVGAVKGKNSEVEVAKIGLLRGGGSYTGFLNFSVKPTNEGALTEAMRIAENGNVGIGTTDPAARLFVSNGGIGTSGTLNITRNGAYIGWNDGLFGGTQFINQKGGGDGGFVFQESTTGNVRTNLMTITGGGSVGIGTSTPKEKLSVNGKIRAHEIKVETANWPDYVFEEGYKVETFEALESYVKTNKRLPEMPSAKEAEANGVELGEMNKLLLKKVEELTLYMIEMKKENETLKNRIGQLEKKVQ